MSHSLTPFAINVCSRASSSASVRRAHRMSFASCEFVMARTVLFLSRAETATDRNA